MVILAIILGLLPLLAVSLLKTYRHVSQRELRRRARQHEPLAEALHRAVAYGLSLDILLWFIVGVSTALFIVILSRGITAWLAFLGALSYLWLAFAWLPNSRVGQPSLWAAKHLSPAIAWILNKLHPILDPLAGFIDRHRPVTIHTGLFEKEDLLELIEHQDVAVHNRIDKEELRLAANALTFGDKLVRDVMTPQRVMKTVKASDAIGPILLDELHASGFSRFPVVGDNGEEIVGTLYLHDLADLRTSHEHVKDIMIHKVHYLHEEAALVEALGAFLKTRHHLFLVVNSFEEIVGLLSLEDVVEQILGRQIMDEFDQYENLRAVATSQAKKEHQENLEPISKYTEEVIQ